MRRAGSFFAVVALFAACSAHPESPPRRAPVVPGTGEAAVKAPEELPLTPADWLHSAEEAEKQGALDVANACRGQAYALEHDVGVLGRWMEGLAANGESGLARQVWTAERRTAEQKGGAEFVKRLDGVIAGLPAGERPVAIAPAGVSEALREAYRAELEGRDDDALKGFSQALGAAPAAYPTAHVGSLRWRKGDVVGARRDWSKARVLFREAGAGFELLPVTTWFATEAAWVGERLVLQRILQPIEPSGQRLSEVQFWSRGASPAVALKWYSEAAPRAMVVSEDGGRVLLSEGTRVVVREALSGVALGQIETQEKDLSVIVASGAGDGLHVLAAARGDVKLWDATGKLLNEHHLEGTTPTIQRVYRAGRGTMHDNLLRDSPTWAVSLALSSDLRFAAAGGSDSKVRLFDRKSGKMRLLEHKWTYEERRPMGGNPDLNLPVDMRFSEKGDRLVVVYRHGELIAWGTADGKAKATVAGACSAEEGTAMVNRYKAPGDAPRAPDASELEGCGGAIVARFDPRLEAVATTGSGIRIRNVATGAGLAFLLGDGPPDDHLAWSRTGTLAMLNIYGGVKLWSAGDKAARTFLKASPAHPIVPSLSSSGRLLWFDAGERAAAWDPVSKREIDLHAKAREILGASEDGRIVARRLPEAVEWVDTASGEVVSRYAVPKDEPVWAFPAAGGQKALLRVQRTPPIHVHPQVPTKLYVCDVRKGECAEPAFGTPNGMLGISGDGRWIIAEAPDRNLTVWEAASGKAAVDMGSAVVEVGFARDETGVAWVEQSDRESRELTANYQRLEGASPGKAESLDLEGWPLDLAVSADGSVVWILLQSKLIRWKPGVDKGVVFEDLTVAGAQQVKVSDDSKTVVLTAYDRITIFANDDALRPLGRLYPLLSGGFLAVSAEGAVDGTADAPASLVTRVTRDKETLVLDGLFGWDAAHVDGVFRRIFAGRSVETPVPAANGVNATSL